VYGNSDRVVSGGVPMRKLDDGELEERIRRIREANAELMKRREVCFFSSFWFEIVIFCLLLNYYIEIAGGTRSKEI
jgi:hypothetical protein